ncbi:MAG: twin-arginine translocase TatA/TatE family subunit [Dehalococcoidia bacterium]
MPRIGPTELIIVLVIIVIVFGVGRMSEVGGGIGKGIREFRRALSGKADDPSEPEEETDGSDKTEV